jgi:hypothetical protein
MSISPRAARRSLESNREETAMQYMLLIYGSEERWDSYSDEERKAIYEEYYALSRDLRDQGKLISSHELQGSATATSVRLRDGKTLTTDGPFAETKERLGGYYLIEADSPGEAVEWAARIPSARDGVVEVRPVVLEHAEVS